MKAIEISINRLFCFSSLAIIAFYYLLTLHLKKIFAPNMKAMRYLHRSNHINEFIQQFLKVFSLILFLTLFSEFIQFNLRVFNIIALFDLIKQLVIKYITLINKKSLLTLSFRNLHRQNIYCSRRNIEKYLP